MAFHDVRFPASISFGSSGGPERRTDVVTLANGFEERNTPWAHSRRRYDAGLGLRGMDDVEQLLAFFEARLGRLHGFRWKDWADYKSCRPTRDVAPADQHLGTGDGSRRSFALVKRYASGGSEYIRPISKPVVDSVRVAVGALELPRTDFTVRNGAVELSLAPEPGVPVTAGFEFDVPVRFDTDVIQVSLSSFEAGEVPDVPIVEVRV